jgi:CubicO group peptidase (beta-lactamase class C family)
MESGSYASLGWDSPISSLIREDFVLAPEYDWAQNHLTLEDALSHRTGFPRHDTAMGTRYGSDNHPATVKDFTRGLRYLPMTSEPRTTWRYCNMMFMVVSHVIQSLTGKWLGDVFKEIIWSPLGMNSTYLSLEHALAGPNHVADSYYWDDDPKGGGFKQLDRASLDEASGAGGIVSNVLDYAKWIRCLLSESKPLSKAGHAAIKTPRMVMPDSKREFDRSSTYALGWQMNTYKGHQVYTHSGGMEAYVTLVYFFPDLDFGLVTFENAAGLSGVVGNKVVWKLVNDKLGIPQEERYNWDVAWVKLSIVYGCRALT